MPSRTWRLSDSYTSGMASGIGRSPEGFNDIGNGPGGPDLEALQVLQGLYRLVDCLDYEGSRHGQVKDVHTVPLGRLELVVEVVGHHRRDVAARESQRHFEDLHYRKASSGVGDMGLSYVCYALGDAGKHLIRREQRAAGIIGDFDPTGQPLVDLVTELLTEK